jgi:DNA-directed RNA polymerase subunit beta'
MMDEFAGRFTAGMGAEAIREILAAIDLDELSAELRAEMKEAASEAKR